MHCSSYSPSHDFIRLFLLLVSLSFTGCTGFDLLNAPISSIGYTFTTNIPYGPDPRQKLDVYRPRDAMPNSRVVIFFYGGEWDHGQKGDYRFAAEAITGQGFIAVIPDYRLHPQVTFPAFVQDGASAVRWVNDHVAEFGGDPRHVYLMGHSAGAHIAALLTLDGHYLKDVGLDPSAIRATAGLSGPYDFQPYGDDRLTFNMTPGQEKPDPDIEPVTFASGHSPPMLLIQGGKDELVSPDNARELQQKICRAGGEARYIIYPDMGHEGIVIALAAPFRWLAPVLRDAAAFFRAH
jgi:acetyl esterase/lipase